MSGRSAGTRVLYRSPGRAYPVAVRAEGAYVWDAQGKRYLDAAAGALVVNVGHGREDIAQVIATQAARLAFVHGSRFTSAPLEELAERLGEWAPPGRWRFFATSGGSEATESAIKLARQVQLERGHTEKVEVISRESSYHGASLGALAASGMGVRRRPYLPLLNEDAFPKMPKPDPRMPGPEDAARLEELILERGPERVAAFVAEPVVGAANPALAPADGYYEEVRRICDRYGVIYVSDEVMTGLGRTGARLGLDHWGVAPDVVVLGKGLAAGYAPLAGILVAEELAETIEQGSGSFTHGFTYSGHPVSAAVGVEVLAVLERERLVERARETGQYLIAKLRRLADQVPGVTEVRGRGLLVGVLLGGPDGEPYTRPGYAYAVAEEALSIGLNLYPGTGSADGDRGDHLLIGPPLTLSRTECDELVDLLGEALTRAGERAGGYQ